MSQTQLILLRPRHVPSAPPEKERLPVTWLGVRQVIWLVFFHIMHSLGKLLHTPGITERLLRLDTKF